jgi:hypothetical protein
MKNSMYVLGFMVYMSLVGCSSGPSQNEVNQAVSVRFQNEDQFSVKSVKTSNTQKSENSDSGSKVETVTYTVDVSLTSTVDCVMYDPYTKIVANVPRCMPEKELTQKKEENRGLASAKVYDDYKYPVKTGTDFTIQNLTVSCVKDLASNSKWACSVPTR